MLHKITLVFVFLLFSAMTVAEDSLRYTKEDLRPLEDSFTEKIKISIGEYLGKETRFSLSVKFDIDFPESTGNNSEAYQDAGYLVVPKVATPATTQSLLFRIKGTKVNVYFYEENYPNDVKENIKSLVSAVAASRGFKSSVAFNYIPAPAIKEKEVITPLEKKMTWKDVFKENSLALSILMGLAFMAMTMLIGAVVFSKFFKSSMVSLSETLRDGLSSSSGNGSRAKAQEPAQTLATVGKEAPSTFERNVRVIKSVLHNSPHAFTRAVSEKDGDYVGLKKLIPALVDSEENIAELLGEKTIQLIEEKSRTEESLSDPAYYHWLDTFVEKLTLHYVRKGNRYTKSIDPKIFQGLLEIPFDLLMSYSLKKNSGMAFKLVLDFLPPTLARDFMDKFSPEQWKLFLADSAVTVEMINLSALEILKTTMEMKKNKGSDISSKEALDEVLVAPVVNYIMVKPLKEVDQFVEQLTEMSPSVSEAIFNKIWTPSLITRVPAEHLSMRMKAFSFEERELILTAMPEKISDLLVTYLPEGKMKEVLKDQVKKNAKLYSKERLHFAERVCRSFLASLYREHAEGQFHLMAPVVPLKKPVERKAA